MDVALAFRDEYSGRPAGIGFRLISDADAEFLCVLYASTRAQELAPVAWPEEMKQHFLREQFGFQHKHYQQVYKDADFLLIQRNGVPIGRIYIDRAAEEICLIDLALIPACRGQGLGSALLAELIDEASRAQRGITLHVEPNNSAQHLYTRVGFKLVEHRGVYDFLRWTPAAG